MPQRTRRATILSSLCLALAVLPAMADEFPRLVPLETILPPDDPPSGAVAPLDERAAALRERAQALRGRVLIDDETRRRMTEIAAR